MSKRAFWVAAIAGCLCLLALPLAAEVSVVLTDGRVFEGIQVTPEGDDYALELSPGEVIIIPGAFVEQVQLQAAPEPEPGPPEEDPDAWRHESGWVHGEAHTLAGQGVMEGAPTGIVTDAEPETLAGYRPHQATRAEQVAVLGPKAEFQKDISGQQDWKPTTDWDMRNGVNNWDPTQWSKGLSDPTWKPESAFDPADDQLKKHESHWQKPIIKDAWEPSDGFKK